MTVLTKTPNIEVVKGTSGQTGTPTTPARAGYYTTVPVEYKVLTGIEGTLPLSALLDNTVPSPSSTPVTSTAYWAVLATHEEIVANLWSGSPTQLCAIAKMVMETIMNTRYQYTPLYTFSDGSILTVAYLDSYASVGICHAYKDSVWPYHVANPKFSEVYWNFSDHYTCSEVNGIATVVDL